VFGCHSSWSVSARHFQGYPRRICIYILVVVDRNVI
jgi:hypothetical protein